MLLKDNLGSIVSVDDETGKALLANPQYKAYRPNSVPETATSEPMEEPVGEPVEEKLEKPSTDESKKEKK